MRIKEKRKDLGITQIELSKLAKIPQQTLQNMENGKLNINNTKIVNLINLAMALNCKISDIIDDNDLQLLEAIEKYNLYHNSI